MASLEEESKLVARALVRGSGRAARAYLRFNCAAVTMELAEAEQAEIKIIQNFLPEQMDEAAMADAVDKAIADAGAQSIKDMGKVMAALKSGNAAAMDMQAAAALVKQRLAAK